MSANDILRKLRQRQEDNKNPKKADGARFKPEEGNYVIRLLTLVEPDEEGSPFKELLYHYKLNGKNYLSPRSYGEADPIADMADALISQGGMSKDEFKTVVKYRPSKSTNALVIVRGQEDKGPQWWSFGKTVYERLCEIMTELNVDEDGNEIADDYVYGMIHDPIKGHDIRMTYINADNSPKKGFPVTELKPIPKKTPLSTDKALAQKWLTEQPTIWEVAGKKHTFEELQKVVESILNPEAASSTSQQSGPPETAWADETPVATVKGNTTKVSAASEEDFDALFSES